MNDRRTAASALGAALAAGALLWLTRAAPLQLGSYWRADALSALFGAITVADLALAQAQTTPASRRPAWRELGAAAVLLVAYSATLTPLIVGCYALLALLAGPQRGAGLTGAPAAARGRLPALFAQAHRTVAAAPWPLAAASLLVGYGALALNGGLSYADRTAGAALSSFVFWFVLLAAALPLAPLRGPDAPAASSPARPRATFMIVAWYYPLARLYSLGPWNTGWSFATLLLGGALAGWCAIAALARPSQPGRASLVAASYLGLALAALGLSTSAGIAAAGFTLLVIPVLAAGLAHARADHVAPGRPPAGALIDWLLAGGLPLGAPFVALWMVIGASLAAGVPLLAGAAWLVALLNGLTVALGLPPHALRQPRARLALAALSAALGVGAPLVVRAAIEPVVAQLQGGLSPYGDFTIWPWVGLAAIDAAHAQATALPSIAIALLVLVLAALIYLIARVASAYAADRPAPPPGGDLPAPAGWLRAARDEVPWLGALLGAGAPPEDPPHERE